MGQNYFEMILVKMIPDQLLDGDLNKFCQKYF